MPQFYSRLPILTDFSAVTQPERSNSLGAGAVEVSLDRKTGKIRVHKVWVAVDGGIIVQPEQARPTGLGGIGNPFIAPVIANAVFRLTGKRLEHLPFTPNRVLAALKT